MRNLKTVKSITIFFLAFLACSTMAYASDESVIAISNFDSSKYLGTWYEIARIPFSYEKDCIAPTTANYALNPEDSSKLIITNKCTKLNQDATVDVGSASFTESHNTGKLEVTFLPKSLSWIPFTHGDYWILYTDYTNYAIVGSPNHKYLWILSRTETFDQDKLNKLLLMAEVQGFDINQLIYNYKGHSKNNETESHS